MELPLDDLPNIVDHHISPESLRELHSELRTQYLAARGWTEKLEPVAWGMEGEAWLITRHDGTKFESGRFSPWNGSFVADAIIKYSLHVSPVLVPSREDKKKLVRSWQVRSQNVRYRKSVTARFLFEATALFVIAMAEREAQERNNVK